MFACAPKGHGFQQDCRLCHDPEKRREWGCDTDAPEPVAWISPCPFCGGRADDCEHCEGTDRVPVLRCPNATVTSREIDAVNAAVLADKGVLPDPGGWQDQPHTFVRVFALLCTEIAHWRSVATQQHFDRKQKGKR